jgi:hypothetical protein
LVVSFFFFFYNYSLFSITNIYMGDILVVTGVLWAKNQVTHVSVLEQLQKLYTQLVE